MMGRTAAVCLAALALSACFSDTGLDPNEACAAGEQKACDCPGAPAAGVQVCRGDGSGFDGCQCEGDGSTSSSLTTSPSTSSGTTDATASSGGPTATSAEATTREPAGSSSSSSTGPGTPPEHVRLFPSQGQYFGNFGATAPGSAAEFVDAECADAGSSFDDCTTFRAVIGLDANRTIASFAEDFDVPTDVPVIGPANDDPVIAPDWDALMTQPLLVEFDNAGFSLDSQLWTGSAEGGSLGPTCSGWTNASFVADGNVGAPYTVNAGAWIYIDTAYCDSSLPVLCACW